MRATVSFLLCIFGLQLVQGPEAAPSSLNAVDILERSTNGLCTDIAKVEKRSYNLLGEEMRDKDEEGKRRIGQMLSFPLLFRTGRFYLSEPITPGANPREWFIIRYEPQPSHERLRPRKGDSEHVEKVLNALTGFVSVEPTLLQVTEIRSNLKHEVPLRIWYKGVIPISITVKQLNFTYWRSKEGETPLPKATLVYRRPAWEEKNREIRDEYSVHFDCKNQ